MNRLFIFAVMATAISMPDLSAQVTTATPVDTVRLSKTEQNLKANAARQKISRLKQLADEKEKITKEEKNALRIKIERIDSLYASGALSEDQSKQQKMEAARIAALNIDNKTAIIENQLALQQRDVAYEFEFAKGSAIELGLGNAYDDSGSMLLGLGFSNNSKRVQYDKRTYSDVVIALGLNSAIQASESFSDSPYKIFKSSYLELGYTFRTRIFEKSNALRFVYGLSLQFQDLEVGNNRYFVDDNGTRLTDFGTNLKKSNMRFDNLVVPLFIEFGPSKKVEYDDRFRYDIRNSFKMGIGGFAGLNLGTVQKLKYDVDGRTVQQKLRADYNTSKFVYGLNSYIGFGAMSLFMKYDLNPLFRDAEPNQHNIAFGLRFDF